MPKNPWWPMIGPQVRIFYWARSELLSRECHYRFEHYCNILLANAPKVVTDRLQRVYWMLLVVWSPVSPVHTSTTTVCRGSCSQSFIGSMCRKEFSINSSSQCRAACTANHRGASQISVYQCPTSQHGSIFDPLLSIFWWFRDAGSAHSVQRPSMWTVHCLGTLYQTAW